MYNLAIIGYGNIGIRHKQKIEDNHQCELLAVSDIKEERLDLIKDNKLKKFENYKELLKIQEIDIVSICTPNHLHCQMTIDALNAKKHVICEKPMALTSSECKKMINAALKNDKKLFIVKQNRYNPPIQAVKKIINENKLGKIFSIVVNCYWNRNEAYYKNSDWKGRKDKDGGALYTQFSHFIDLMYWFGGDVKTVFANADNFNHSYIEIEDTGSASIVFENGIIGTVNFTNCAYGKNMEGSITIFAEKGTVKIGGQYLNELEYQNIKDVKIQNLPTSQGPNEYGEYRGSMSNHHKVYENVVNTLNGDDVIDVNGIEGMKTVEIIEAAYKSIESSRIIFL